MIQGVIEILVEDSGVQDAVGQNKAANKYKVYPVRAPQKEEPPYIVVFKLPSIPTLDKHSVSTLDECKFRAIGYVKNYIERDAITEAIRGALDGKESVTDAGINFSSIWYETDSDGFDEPAQLYAAIVDFGCLVIRE